MLWPKTGLAMAGPAGPPTTALLLIVLVTLTKYILVLVLVVIKLPNILVLDLV